MDFQAIDLDYGATLTSDNGKRRIDNVSGVTYDGKFLWTATDEKATIERLSSAPDGQGYAKAKTFKLKDYFGDDFRKVEADIEGLSFDRGRLWMIGSHALARDASIKEPDVVLQLTKPEREVSRTLLGYLQIAEGKPVDFSGRILPLGSGGGTLIDAISGKWPVLRDAAQRPSKENGLDIEGIAVDDMRVFLGLRGPVIGKSAIVIEVNLVDTGSRLEIAFAGGKASCRAHLIDTGGLGIRDLTIKEGRLVILSGPTMDSEGPFELYAARLPEPGSTLNPEFLQEIEIRRIADPSQQGRSRGDRPEAITFIDDRLLVLSERKINLDTRPKTVLEGQLLTVPPLP